MKLKVKALVHAFENHSSQYYRAGQFFWREGRVTLKIRVDVKVACSKRSDSGERCEVKIAPHYLNAWNRLRSKRHSGLKSFGSVYGEKLKVREIGILVCVFARKWNEFIFRKSFVSVFVAYELVFCAFVPVLSTVYSIVSLFGVESRLVYIPFQRWWGKQKGKRSVPYVVVGWGLL